MSDSRSDETGTWHYGLMARWWAEFNVAEPDELAYYRTAIKKFGEPALDLGCGTGRLLIPLCAEGLDVDGTDVSVDMIAMAQAAAEKVHATPTLLIQALHELELKRRYRTMYTCGVFGIGGRRDRDLEALRRIYSYLERGGALLINHWLPYNEDDLDEWGHWLPSHRPSYPRPWPDQGNRRRCADGDELEIISRVAELDPLNQLETQSIRARSWHDGVIAKEESYNLKSCIYFAQEVVSMLEAAGFGEVAIDGGYTGHPAKPEDGMVTFVARRLSE